MPLFYNSYQELCFDSETASDTCSDCRAEMIREALRGGRAHDVNVHQAGTNQGAMVGSDSILNIELHFLQRVVMPI